jgi:hypothetical protein
VADSWLHEAMCRERDEMRLRVDYIKLSVDRDMNCGYKLVTKRYV